MSLFDEIAANSKLALAKGNTDFWNVDLQPCGIPPVDHCLGGGFAFGRVTEMFGNESSGKSLILYKLLIENTKAGGTSVLIDAEGSFNPDFYRSLGGDPDTLLIHAGLTVEKVFDLVLKFCTIKKKSKNSADKMVVGWDSVAETGTDHLQETGMTTVDMSHPRMMSQGFKLVKAALRETNIAFVCINQTREKIASPGTRQPPGDITPGGKALKFAASQRLRLHYTDAEEWKIREDLDDQGDSDDKKVKKLPQQIGRKVLCEALKSKVGGAWINCKLFVYSFNGAPHPIFEGLSTEVGVDVDESLLDFYLDGYFFLPNRSRVVNRGSPGWYMLDVSLDSEQEKFRKKDWPKVLEKHPELRELVYDLAELQDSPTSAAEQLPTPPADSQVS